VSRKTKNAPILNDEISVLGKEVTVGLLVELLSGYPQDAKIALQNFNAGTLLGGEGLFGVGITAITAANVTKRDDRTVFLNQEGPINTVILGFWDEGNMYIEDSADEE
jgi:hypothetical protein